MDFKINEPGWSNYGYEKGNFMKKKYRISWKMVSPITHPEMFTSLGKLKYPKDFIQGHYWEHFERESEDLDSILEQQNGLVSMQGNTAYIEDILVEEFKDEKWIPYEIPSA